MTQELFETLGIAGLFFIALVFIVRKLSEQFFSKNLEKFKADLQLDAVRHKARVETLQAEQASVIKEVYSQIVTTEDTFSSLMKPMQEVGEAPLKDKEKILVDELNKLSRYYYKNRLFFQESLAKEIDGLLLKFRDIWIDWRAAKGFGSSEVPDVEKWAKTWDKVKDDIPPVKTSIEKKFREIIGVDDKSSQG